MWKIALRGVVAHKLRLGATLLAVALGVAFIGGVLTMGDSMNRTLDDLFATAYASTDAVVRSDEVIAGELGEEDRRGTLDAALLDRVRAVDTVLAADPEVGGLVRIVGRDGEPLGGGTFDSPTVATNWTTDDDRDPAAAATDDDGDPADPATDGDGDGNPFRLRDGRWPRAADEIVLDAQTARGADYAVGDVVPVQTARGVVRYRLVGVVGFGSADSPAGQSLVLFTTDETQRAVGKPGRFDAINVVATPGTPQDRVVDDIRAVVGDGVEVLSGRAVVEQSQSDVRESLSFLTVFLLVFAVIAVVVGSFVIYNSFSIVVAQRTRELALLRAVGASRRQVRSTVVAEAVVTGLLGSAVGFALGLGVATVLLDLLGIESPLSVRPATLAIAVGCGLVVTVVSALVPARRASKVPPLVAMRQVAVDTAGRSRVRLALGAGLALVGALAVVAGVRQGEEPGVGLGVGAVFLGLLLAGPGLARPVGALVGWPLGRLWGVSGVLARRNAGRNPRRTASTAQALMVGVGIVAFFLVVNASIRASIERALDESFVGDLVVDAGGAGAAGLPPAVAEQVAAQPEVRAVVPLRSAPAQVIGPGGRRGAPGGVVATSPAGPRVLGLDVVDGSPGLARGEIMVSDAAAGREGLAVGDRLGVDLLDAPPVELVVTGVYAAASDVTGVGDHLIGIGELAAQLPESVDAQLVVQLTDGASPGRAERALERILEPYPTADVLDAEDYEDSLASELDVFLRLVLGLLSLTIVIAVLGIANTVGLSVLERTRELGLLRAVGMSRRQVRSLVRWESVIIALFGTLLGLAVGALGGWGVVAASAEEDATVFRMPVGVLVGLAALAGLLGMLAALGPAWRASRLDVLDAIHAE